MLACKIKFGQISESIKIDKFGFQCSKNLFVNIATSRGKNWWIIFGFWLNLFERRWEVEICLQNLTVVFLKSYYYDNSLELVKKDGLIIIDNVLWRGEVADERNNDKFTNIIRDFNIHVKEDKKTEQVILPLGDGFTVSRKL